MKRLWRPLIVLWLSILKIPDGWYRKSLSLSGLNRYEEALEALDHALALDPQDAYSWYRKSLSLSILDRDEEALEALDHALTLDPNNAAAWYLKGVSLIDIDNEHAVIDGNQCDVCVATW